MICTLHITYNDVQCLMYCHHASIFGEHLNKINHILGCSPSSDPGASKTRWMPRGWLPIQCQFGATHHPAPSVCPCSTLDGWFIVMGQWRITSGLNANWWWTGLSHEPKQSGHSYIIMWLKNLRCFKAKFIQWTKAKQPVHCSSSHWGCHSFEPLARTTRECASFASESAYVVPTSGKDSLPLAAEGFRFLGTLGVWSWFCSQKICYQCLRFPTLRSLSDVQESAQMLAGPGMPTIVLQSVLAGLQGHAGVVGVINMSPYDSHLEKVCVHWKLEHGNDSPQLKCFSISDQAEEVLFSERLLTHQLLQDKSSCVSKIVPQSG